MIYPLIVLLVASVGALFNEFVITPWLTHLNQPSITPTIIIDKYFKELSFGNKGNAFDLYSSSYQRKVGRIKFNSIADEWEYGSVISSNEVKDISTEKFSIVDTLIKVTNKSTKKPETYQGYMYLINEHKKWKIYDNGLKKK